MFSFTAAIPERKIIAIAKSYVDVSCLTDELADGKRRSNLKFLLFFSSNLKNLLFLKRFMLKNNVDNSHLFLCPTYFPVTTYDMKWVYMTY